MKELHALVDFENVQPSLDELAKLAPGFTDLWLFHGPHQAKQAEQLAASHKRVTPVPRSGKGPNALDFQLSFYLGYVAAKHPDAHLVVIANDQGYDPMIEHAHKVLGFTAKRVGFKTKKAPAVKKAASAKAPAPDKKAATKQPAAKQAAPKQPPAKQAPAKKAAAKKAAPPQAQAKAALASESKEFTRVKNGLAKMGDKAPHKLKSFLRHVKAMLGKDSTAAQIDAVVAKLEAAGAVRVAGEVVSFCA